MTVNIVITVGIANQKLVTVPEVQNAVDVALRRFLGSDGTTIRGDVEQLGITVEVRRAQ